MSACALHRVDRWLRFVASVTGVLALGFLGFMMVGITVDALVRTFVGNPLPGLFEMAELSMVMIVFMGLGWTQMDEAHIRVTLGRKLLPGRAVRLLDGLAWLLAALMLVALAWPSTLEALESVAIREFRWGYLEVPIWWAKVAVAFGLWFGALQMLSSAVRALCAPAQAPRHDTPALAGQH